MDPPCTNVQCFILRLRARNSLTTVTVTETSAVTISRRQNNDRNFGAAGGGNLAVESSFRILLPILIVLGVFIILVLSLVLYRLVTKLMKKRALSREEGADSSRSSDAAGRRRGRGSGRNVNTVSDHQLDSPPTYNDMLANIENGESPPAYYLVMSGVVNVSYAHENDAQDTSQSETSAGSTNQVTERENNVTPAPEYVETDGVIGGRSEVAVTQVTSLRSASNVNSTPLPVAQLNLAPTRNIDFIIDSISVPSILLDTPPDLTHDCLVQSKSIKKNKRRASPVNASLPLTEPTQDHLARLSATGLPLSKPGAVHATLTNAVARQADNFMVQATSV